MSRLTEVKLAINMPFDRPNKNGTIFTKEAIENAVCNMRESVPIIYENDVVGTTIRESCVATWDYENQACKIASDGVLFHCNPRIVVNEIKDAEISDFRVVGIGLTT